MVQVEEGRMLDIQYLRKAIRRALCRREQLPDDCESTAAVLKEAGTIMKVQQVHSGNEFGSCKRTELVDGLGDSFIEFNPDKSTVT